MRAWLVVAAAACCAGAAAAQQPPAADVRLYRMYQGGAEVGRETYRVIDPRTFDFSVVIPLLDLKQDTRIAIDERGRFERLELRAANATGDSLRATATVWREGDSLRYRQVVRGQPREGALHVPPPDGVIPGQTVAIVASLAERAAGRDTVFRMLPLGADTIIQVAVRFRGDTAALDLGGVLCRARMQGGRAGTVEIPLQGIVAPPWNGVDSLPPLAGTRRPPVDYAAPPGAAYTAQDVRIPMRALSGDTFTTAATLTLPAAARGRVPAVVTISGSGQQQRDEDLWPVVTGYRPFRQVAERLAQEGIAVLRYDDRAAGASTGTPGTTADNADDVRQLVAWLRARPDIDGGRIALLGHSEGGAIGPMVAAADGAIAAVVVMAGPGKTGAAILRDQLTRPVLTARGLTDEERAAALARVDEQLDAFRTANAWTRWFTDYDPLPAARRLRQPVLILQGELDRQVSAGQADTLAAAVRAGGNRDVTVRIFPRLNHLFLPTSGDGSPLEYVTLEQVDVPREVLDTIADWLAPRLRRPSRGP